MPACQILPPNFPSYTPYCPFTTGAQTVWSGPNIAKAKALVKASGTAGTKVVVNGTNDQVGKELAEQMVSDLDSIGYKASTQLLGSGPQYSFVQNSANSSKWNVAWSAWYQDYPAQSDFLNVLLGCGTIHPNSDASPNIAAFCDKSINSQILQAENLETDQPVAGSQPVDAGRPRDHPAGAMGRPVQPQADRLPVQECPRLRVEPAVVHPHRPAVAVLLTG